MFKKMCATHSTVFTHTHTKSTTRIPCERSFCQWQYRYFERWEMDTTTVPPDSQLYRKERGRKTHNKHTSASRPLPCQWSYRYFVWWGMDKPWAPWLAATQERKGGKNHNKKYLGIESLVDDYISIFYDEGWTPLCPLTRGHTVPWPHDLVRRLAIWQRQPLWAVYKYVSVCKYMNIYSCISIAAWFGPSPRHLAVVAVFSSVWIRIYKYKYNHVTWSVVSQSGSGSFEQFKITYIFMYKSSHMIWSVVSPFGSSRCF